MEEFLELHPDHSKWGHCFTTGNEKVRLHYVRQGSGVPVLLLHGWPGFWYDWRRVIPLLKEKVDVIAPDFRGFNQSAQPEIDPTEAYTPEIFVEDIVSLLDELQIPNVMIVAYDIGAVVAQKLTLKYPERVNSLVLLNPPYPGIGSRLLTPKAQRELWYHHFHQLPWCDQLLSYDWVTTHLYLNHFYTYWLADKKSIRPKEFEAIVEIYCRSENLRSTFSYFRSEGDIWHQQIPENTTPISQPTTVLWSKLDPLFPVEWSDKLADYFSQLDLQIIEEASHFIPFETPEKVVQAILSRIEKN